MFEDLSQLIKVITTPAGALGAAAAVVYIVDRLVAVTQKLLEQNKEVREYKEKQEFVAILLDQVKTHRHRTHDYRNRLAAAELKLQQCERKLLIAELRLAKYEELHGPLDANWLKSIGNDPGWGGSEPGR